MNPTVKRLLLILLALFPIVYVGAQIFSYFFSSPVQFETVNSFTVYDRLEVEGIAIRSEQVLKQASSGYVYYTLKNGSRVAKGGVIAQVYPSESDALAEKNVAAVDEEIETLQTLQKQGSVSKTNLEMLNTLLAGAQNDLVKMVKAGNFEEAASVRSEMMELLNRKQILVGKVNNFEERIAALTKKRDALASGGYKSATGTVTSPVAGYFVSSPDGYETMFDYDDVTGLTVNDVETALKATPQADTGSIGKVVGNFEWYLACIVPVDKLSMFGEKQELNVMLPFVAEDAIPVTVEKINKQGNKAMVLLKCSYMSEALSAARCEQIQILRTEYTGLYVPDEALQFDKNNEPGVFVRNGTTLQFCRVKIDYHSETGKYSICDPDAGTAVAEPEPKTTATGTAAAEEDTEETEDVPYLKLYDDMVVGGKDLYEGKIVH